MCVHDDPCTIGQIMTEGGYCEGCPPWTHPDVDGLRCIKDTCDYSVAILTDTGKCDICPPYKIPAPLNENGDSTSCMDLPCDFAT
jgi:hypothetical protein